MRYQIHYTCWSHPGKLRNSNQDNFICDGRYMDMKDSCICFPLHGTKASTSNPVFAVFDGMGGEECGEVAAYIAAKNAASLRINGSTATTLFKFCRKANQDICEYAALHNVSAMGTTAAILAFTNKEITLCNIGDSKIFRFYSGILEQISKDHISVSPYGVKPPLLQNLGIPPDELIIEPYLAHGTYNEGDLYLLCSDGLTDMVSKNEIAALLAANPAEKAASLLFERALVNGGKDNITLILCEIERQLWPFCKRVCHTKRNEV